MAIWGIVLGANILSFALAQLMAPEWFKKPRLETLWHSPGSGLMNYFVAGTLNQPKPAYQFIMNDIKGGVTWVSFRNTGWEAELTAKAILNHARRHDYKKIRVFAISVGDHVARYLEDFVRADPEIQLEVIAINPCSSPTYLNDGLRGAIKAAPALQITKYLLGWASLLPVIPTPGEAYSVALLEDQLLQVSRVSTPRRFERTLGVVLSKNDELLDNGRIITFLPDDVATVTIDTTHGNTIDAAKLYREATQKILQNTQF